MSDKYIFDKRVMKKVLLKYGIIFLIAFPILLFTNYYLNKVMKFWLVILVDVVITLFIIFIAQLIINAYKNHQENKPEKIEVNKKAKPKPTKTKFTENDEEVVDAVEVNNAKNLEPEVRPAATKNKANKKPTIVIKSNKKDK